MEETAFSNLISKQDQFNKKAALIVCLILYDFEPNLPELTINN